MSYSYFGNPNNPLILFIHGAGVEGWMWDQQVDHFKHTHYCIVPTYQMDEQRGIQYWATTFLKDLQPHMKDNRQFILVGFSMGAQIAVQMCAERLDMFSHVMVNSGLIDPKPVLRKIIQPLLPLFNILPKSRWFSLKQAKELYITEPFYFERYFAGARNVRTADLRAIMNENLTFDLPEEISQYSGEMLITIGDKEEKLLTRSVDKLSHAVPKAKVFVIPDMKHGYPLGRAESFNRLLDVWIKGEVIKEGEIM
ncbi:alpha/beta fold hydrolase [Alkalicoccobacillus porphyridii]|uniref:Alpha/beta hydrolase n=1 Tax=Alkalicoccobacillus porphyridii TaxID=2597270 RepID=A0A553ZTL7_9BACI|nr:alpha/beta hydrolase [Alkalicoccobacillus porphyridii]TSB44819.1 alpha/beta hydrolase [Alkalicoccobacillus porphyridii]